MPLVREKDARHATLEPKQDVLVKDVRLYAALKAGARLDAPGFDCLDPAHQVASCIGRQFGQSLPRFLQLVDARSLWVVKAVLTQWHPLALRACRAAATEHYGKYSQIAPQLSRECKFPRRELRVPVLLSIPQVASPRSRSPCPWPRLQPGRASPWPWRRNAAPCCPRASPTAALQSASGGCCCGRSHSGIPPPCWRS